MYTYQEKCMQKKNKKIILNKIVIKWKWNRLKSG